MTLLQDKAFMVVQWFGVSDEFYHELSMAFSVLPNSHLLKKVQKKLNEMVEIEAILLPHRGTFRPFRSMLAAALSVKVSTCTYIIIITIAICLDV